MHPGMREPILTWVRSQRQSIDAALCMIDRGDLGPSVTVCRDGRPELPGPDADPEEVLRGIVQWKGWALARRGPRSAEEARADDAMLAACRLAAADDGSVDALARFMRAASYSWLLECRAQQAEEGRLILTLPHARPARPDAVAELLRIALRNARFDAARNGGGADLPPAPSNELAAMCVEVARVLDGEADPEVGRPLLALLRAVERDDGSPPSWQAIRYGFGRYMRALVDRCVVEAEEVFSTLRPGVERRWEYGYASNVDASVA